MFFMVMVGLANGSLIFRSRDRVKMLEEENSRDCFLIFESGKISLGSKYIQVVLVWFGSGFNDST